MAYRRWSALSTLTAVAVLCFAGGTSATNATGLELSFQKFDKYDVCVTFLADISRITLATPAAPARHNDIEGLAVALSEAVTFGAKAEAVAAKSLDFLFTEAGQAIAEWGRLRS